MYGHHNSYLTTVEAKRVGVNCDKIPVAVLQWQSMVRKHCQAYKQIAVNYAARAFGVNRFNCTPDEAKRRCPDLRLIHVATYGVRFDMVTMVANKQPGDNTPQYYEHPDSQTHKVSLDLYRRESKKIMSIFQCELTHDYVQGNRVQYDLAPVIAENWAPNILDLKEHTVDNGILFEKASIDESFFDLSVYVRQQLLLRFPFLDIRDELENLDSNERTARLDAPIPPVPLFVRQELVSQSWKALGAWWPSDPQEAIFDISWQDIVHAIGAERMISMRKHIRDILGYTTSAGIASNKMLAKVCFCVDLSYAAVFIISKTL